MAPGDSEKIKNRELVCRGPCGAAPEGGGSLSRMQGWACGTGGKRNQSGVKRTEGVATNWETSI